MNEDSQQSLYLLRHAKAAPWAPGVNDFERLLSERGQQHMQELAVWIGTSLSPPGIILCSPSARTRGTLAPIAAEWPELGDSTRYIPEIYEATTGVLHALADEAFAAGGPVMMVGHNPGFECLVLALLRETDAAGLGKMPVGTLAVIDFKNGWKNDAGRGVLRHWIRSTDLLQSQHESLGARQDRAQG
jgi:phosphohistidine phosphatase